MQKDLEVLLATCKDIMKQTGNVKNFLSSHSEEVAWKGEVNEFNRHIKHKLSTRLSGNNSYNYVPVIHVDHFGRRVEQYTVWLFQYKRINIVPPLTYDQSNPRLETMPDVPPILRRKLQTLWTSVFDGYTVGPTEKHRQLALNKISGMHKEIIQGLYFLCLFWKDQEFYNFTPTYIYEYDTDMEKYGIMYTIYHKPEHT